MPVLRMEGHIVLDVGLTSTLSVNQHLQLFTAPSPGVLTTDSGKVLALDRAIF